MFATLVIPKIIDIHCAFFDGNLHFMNIFNRDKRIEEIYAPILIILYPPFFMLIYIYHNFKVFLSVLKYYISRT